jgi:DNA replication and repair protein RecF
VAATAARLALVRRLNDLPPANGGMGHAEFPAAQIGLVCGIADRLAVSPALEVEDWLRTTLAENRRRDAASGTAAVGAHRADMVLTDAATRTESALASTGQQKALLIGLILSHARLVAEARGFAPLLLLDEPAVHLDEARRASLFQALCCTPAQVIVTGTDAETFRPLADQAEAWRVDAGELHREKGFLIGSPLSSGFATC